MPDRRRQLLAGKSRQRIEVYKNVPTVAADGQVVENGTLQCERWATIMPAGGAERVLDEQQHADYTHIFELWSDTFTREIQPEWWFVHKTTGKRYDVVRIYDPVQDNTKLQAQCNERI